METVKYIGSAVLNAVIGATIAFSIAWNTDNIALALAGGIGFSATYAGISAYFRGKRWKNGK